MKPGPNPEVLRITIDPREGLRRLVSAPPMRPVKHARKGKVRPKKG